MVANPHGCCKNGRVLRAAPEDFTSARHCLGKGVLASGHPPPPGGIRPMRITVLSLIAAAALIAPIAALADAAPTTSSAANQFCKQQQTTLGTSFATAYRTF